MRCDDNLAGCHNCLARRIPCMHTDPLTNRSYRRGEVLEMETRLEQLEGARMAWEQRAELLQQQVSVLTQRIQRYEAFYARLLDQNTAQDRVLQSSPVAYMMDPQSSIGQLPIHFLGMA
jgi:hypothetical protein